MATETRIAIAALATGGSALFQPSATHRVFSIIAGGPVPAPFLTVLTIIGAFGVAATIVAFVKSRRGFGHAIVALAAVALLDPVLAVGLVFLIAHAIPVQQRQIANYGSQTVWRAVAIPTFCALAGAAAVAILAITGSLPVMFAVALAFGMATPHMLTERLER